MRRCEYCGETFETEGEELRHLRDEHGAELGPIDRRRAAKLDSGEGTNPLVYGVAVGGLVLIALLAYLVFFTGGSNGDAGSTAFTPHHAGSVHEHGSITVTIDGRTLDFSKQQYQLQNDHFHFEDGNGDRWHVHSRDVTLAYAMRTLGIDVGRNVVTFEGTTYRDGEQGTSVIVRVNGEAVDPSTYALQDGDAIRIVARTNGSA